MIIIKHLCSKKLIVALSLYFVDLRIASFAPRDSYRQVIFDIVLLVDLYSLINKLSDFLITSQSLYPYLRLIQNKSQALQRNLNLVLLIEKGLHFSLQKNWQVSPYGFFIFHLHSRNEVLRHIIIMLEKKWPIVLHFHRVVHMQLVVVVLSFVMNANSFH